MIFLFVCLFVISRSINPTFHTKLASPATWRSKIQKSSMAADGNCNIIGTPNVWHEKYRKS